MLEPFVFAVDGTWVDIPGGWVTLIGVVLTVIVGPILTLVVTARLSGRVKEMKADVAATKDQVANDHVDQHGEPINMRVEQDDRHDEIMTTLSAVVDTQKALGETVGAMSRDIGGIRADVRNLYSADGEQVRQQNRDRERLDALEKTYPRDELGRFTNKEKQ